MLFWKDLKRGESVSRRFLLYVLLVAVSLVWLFGTLGVIGAWSHEKLRLDAERSRPFDKPVSSKRESSFLPATLDGVMELDVGFVPPDMGPVTRDDTLPGDTTLARSAMAVFAKHSNWEGALLASLLLPEDSVPTDVKFDFVNRIYLREFSRAYASVSETARKNGARIDPDGKGTLFFEHVMLLSNTRLTLCSNGVPLEIADIMLSQFLRLQEDPVVVLAVQSMMMDRIRSAPYPYTDTGRRQFFETLLKRTPDLFARLVKRESDRIFESVNAQPPEFRKWFFGMPGTKNQREFLSVVHNPRRSAISPKDFLLLPTPMRDLLLLRIVREVPETFRNAFRDALDARNPELLPWIEFFKNHRTPSQRTMNFFRRAPAWLAALFVPDYPEARKILEHNWLVLFGEPPSQEVRERFFGPLGVEEQLFRKTVKPALWDAARKKIPKKELARNQTETFLRMLRDSFVVSTQPNPDRIRAEKLLQIVSEVNRGTELKLTDFRGFKQETLEIELKIKE